MIKPFLLLQSRPEDSASDSEYKAFCHFGGLNSNELERLRLDTGTYPKIDLNKYSGIIMGGGPANFAYDYSEKSANQIKFENYILPLMRQIIDEDKPFLGACLGMGALVSALGGKPSFDYGEDISAVDVQLEPASKNDTLVCDLPNNFRAFVGHKEGVGSIEGLNNCVVLAKSEKCLQLVRAGQNVYAAQFHPELDVEGLILRINIYKYAGYFNPSEAQNIIDKITKENITEPVKILRKFIDKYAVKLD